MKELAAAKTKKNFIIGQPIVDFGLWLYMEGYLSASDFCIKREIIIAAGIAAHFGSNFPYLMRLHGGPPDTLPKAPTATKSYLLWKTKCSTRYYFYIW